MTRAIGLATLVMLAGCPYEIPEGRYACSANSDCPAEFFCNGSGLCDRGGSDAAVPDAPDAPSCADEDMDGACADVDCDDDNNIAYPGATERCTVSASMAPATDEDCDGVIDEGCRTFFGEPHWVTDVLARDGGITSPSLSMDGLSLYACALDERGLSVPVVAGRASRTERFAAFEEIGGDWGPASIVGFAMGGGGLEALVVAKPSTSTSTTLSRYTRASIEDRFLMQEMTGEGYDHPSFSPDGLEMVASSMSGVVLGTRESVNSPFSGLTLILPGTYRSPSFIGPDALMLLDDGTGGDSIITFARRSEASGEFAIDPARWPSLGPIDDIAYDVTHRELIFTSRRAWTPVSAGSPAIWRAEVCRDDACPDRRVDCTGADEHPSEDGTHCYRVGEPPSSAEVANESCGESRDGHALSLHSAAERDWVALMLPDDRYWTAGRYSGPSSGAWTTGEAWTNNFVEASASDGCVQFVIAGVSGSVETGECDLMYRSICETEFWPTW